MKHIWLLGFVPFLLPSCKSIAGREQASEVSGDESLSDDALMDLARKVAPQIRFHKDEQFFPSSVEHFAEHTHITLDGGQEVAGSVMNAGSLPWNPDHYYASTRVPLKDPNDIQDFMRGQDPRNGKPPIYLSIYSTRPGTYNFQFMVFYPYNRGKDVCYSLAPLGHCLTNRVTMGSHVGDWESMTLQVQGGRVTAIRVGAHENRYTVDLNRVEFVEKHPVIYAAKGSHGLYEKPGDVTYKKIPTGDSLIDEVSGGFPWFTWDNMVLVTGNEEWARYRGHWGNPVMGKTACQLTPLPMIDKLRGVTNPIAGWFGKKVESTEQVCARFGLNTEYELGAGPWWQDWQKDKDGF